MRDEGRKRRYTKSKESEIGKTLKNGKDMMKEEAYSTQQVAEGMTQPGALATGSGVQRTMARERQKPYKHGGPKAVDQSMECVIQVRRAKQLTDSKIGCRSSEKWTYGYWNENVRTPSRDDPIEKLHNVRIDSAGGLYDRHDTEPIQRDLALDPAMGGSCSLYYMFLIFMPPVGMIAPRRQAWCIENQNSERTPYATTTSFEKELYLNWRMTEARTDDPAGDCRANGKLCKMNQILARLL
nr:hypothetical protein Iba_chr06eCG6550 [Ipomoea batatas]